MSNKWILTLLIVFSLIMPVLAQEGMPPMPELDGDIVIEGLNGPQGLFMDTDGSLLVIDSGMGGEETVPFINTTSLELVDGAYGETTRVVRLTADGEAVEVAALPSIAAGEDFLGGARITSLDGTLYATVGGWHGSLGETVTIDNYGGVVSITDGMANQVADLWAHELENNPDGTINLESHPFGIIAGSDGLLYIADAAANAIISVDPSSGATTTVASFDAMPGVFPNPIYDGAMLTDPVPTAAVMNDDGSLYVSLLSGAPFIPGSAKVVKVESDGTVSDFVTGMTMLTDLKAGPDGNLYAISFGMFTEEGPVFNSGSVIRILEDGISETIIEGLPFATAIALDDMGNGYVAINGVAIPGAGMVVYYEGLTSKEIVG